MKSIYVISLGCDKNRVDTENFLYILKNEGFSLTSEIEEAQVVIINTCAFLNSAREEAINTILECAQYKQKNLEKLIVTGCLPEKYIDEIKDELPEVDAFLGINGYGNIGKVIKSLYEGQRVTALNNCPLSGNASRLLTTPMHYAYLKIADGCNNFCSYCLIPKIRGRYRSRALESLIDEAKELSSRGVKEIILVAQDLTRYGYDLYKEYKLPQLVRSLSKIDGIEWIRLMYCYPETVTGELIEVIADNPKVCKYIDIPLQHVSTRILKAMNRRSDYDSVARLIERIRQASPDIAIRSTFITGFPDETQEDFDILCGFLKKYKLTHAGFFSYSREEGTAAHDFPGQVDESIKAERLDVLHRIQQKISLDNNKSNVGKTFKVLYEGIDYDRQMFFGRSYSSAPDIDGKIFFNAKSVDIGNFYDILISGYEAYDLLGKKV